MDKAYIKVGVSVLFVLSLIGTIHIVGLFQTITQSTENPIRSGVVSDFCHYGCQRVITATPLKLDINGSIITVSGTYTYNMEVLGKRYTYYLDGSSNVEFNVDICDRTDCLEGQDVRFTISEVPYIYEGVELK